MTKWDEWSYAWFECPICGVNLTFKQYWGPDDHYDQEVEDTNEDNKHQRLCAHLVYAHGWAEEGTVFENTTQEQA